MAAPTSCLSTLHVLRNSAKVTDEIPVGDSWELFLTMILDVKSWLIFLTGFPSVLRGTTSESARESLRRKVSAEVTFIQRFPGSRMAEAIIIE